MTNPNIESCILGLLKAGPHRTAEIKAAISEKPSSVANCLMRLKKEKKIVSINRGNYQLAGWKPEASISVAGGPSKERTDADNRETINKVLDIYDQVLDSYSGTLAENLKNEPDAEEQSRMLTNFKTLAMMVDTLMKRWYLVHRGYDNNPRQAQEDAKQKAVIREKQTQSQLPPEDQLLVVGDYHESMKEILKAFPPSEKNTV